VVLISILKLTTATVKDDRTEFSRSEPESLVENYDDARNQPRSSLPTNRTSISLNPGVRSDKINDKVMLSDSGVSTPKCRLSPRDETLPARLKKISHDDQTHLIEYKIKFSEYISEGSTGPLKISNKTFNYKPDQWYRVFSKQGWLLSRLSFGYASMSFNMLGVGVEKMSVAVVDTPPMCFTNLNESEQVAAIRTILANDLNEEGDLRGARKEELAAARWVDDDNRLCYEVIKESKRVGTFQFECCKHTLSGVGLECKSIETDNVIYLVNILITVLKISFFFFGPLFLQKIVFGDESTAKTNYVVPLDRELQKTILVKKVRVDDDNEPMRGHDDESSGRRGEMRQFTKFRQLVKTIQSEEITQIRFRRLDIVVDHRDIMSEDCVPVGLLPLVYDFVARCGIMREEPFHSCCIESIFGSWSPYFIWLKLKKRSSDCNLGCREWCAWGTIFRCAGCVLFMLLLPLPYYARLGYFYAFEKNEMKERTQALERHDLKHSFDRNLYQWLAPDHVGLIVIYIVYIVSYLLLAALRFCDEKKIDSILHECVSDMRNIRYVECARLVFSHLLLPFEKFGIFGIIAGAIYWPIVLPICILISLGYCLPTLYVTFRLILQTRPGCLKTRPMLSEEDDTFNLSNGVTSFERCFLLDSISPENVAFTVSTSPERRKPNRLIKKRFRVSTKNLGASCSNFLAGLLLLLCLLSLLLLYAETFGFFVEVFVMALLGAVLNASQVVIYVTLAIWCLVYVIFLYRHTCCKYYNLSRVIFKFIKDCHVQSMEASLWCPSDRKAKNNAFKFFSHEELDRIQHHVLAVTRNKPFVPDASSAKALKLSPGNQTKKSGSPTVSFTKGGAVDIQDSIEYLDNRLHWKLNSLVLFIDKNDVIRIPRDIYWQICNLDVPGCPGPVYKAWLKALGLLIGALVYLSFIFCVLWSFGTSYVVSTGTQICVALAGGSLPFLVYWVSNGPRSTPQLTSLSLLDKVRQVFFDYRRAWLVYDLSFSRSTQPGGGGCTKISCRRMGTTLSTKCCYDAVDGSAHCHDFFHDGPLCDSNGLNHAISSHPSHTPPHATTDSPELVDLLITIRDDSTDDNRRGSVHSDSVSLDYSNSLNAGGAQRLAGHREDTGGSKLPRVHPTSLGVGGVSSGGGGVNHPTNATLSTGPRHAGATCTFIVTGEDEYGVDRFALRKEPVSSILSNWNTMGGGTTQGGVSLNMVDMSKCSGGATGSVEYIEQGTSILANTEGGGASEYPTLFVGQSRDVPTKGESEL